MTDVFRALFLLAGNCLRRALAGPGVGVSALAAHGQTATMAQSTVAAEIHQPLDVHRNFAPQIALDHVVAVDHLAQLQHFLVGQLRHPARFRDRGLFQDLLGFGLANSIDILQRDDDALVGRQIDASDTSHVSYSLQRPSRLGRVPEVLLSPGEGHKRKKPTPACRLGPGIASLSPTGYLRLINGFTALSSTSTSDFVYERG